MYPLLCDLVYILKITGRKFLRYNYFINITFEKIEVSQ